jgi:hypothetical protein
VVDGLVNRDEFEAFVGQVLVPSLNPGDVVVMDNLSGHKGPKVKRLIESAGNELVCPPPYSPDLSPIEPAFSKIKGIMGVTACAPTTLTGTLCNPSSTPSHPPTLSTASGTADTRYGRRETALDAAAWVAHKPTRVLG